MNLLKRVKILTPESVELEFTLAGVGGRAIGLIIDYLLLFLGMAGLLWLWVYIIDTLEAVLQDANIEDRMLGMWIISIFFLLLFIWYIGYFVIFETYWYGQTPGKRLAKVRVIRDNGQPTRLFQSTLRALMRPIDDVLFFGYFLVLFGKQEKRIGDFLAGTLVVQVDPRTATNKIVLSEQGKRVGEKLLEAMRFDRVSPDDFAVVREYLQRRQIMLPNARTALSLSLATQLRETAGLEELPERTTPNVFLEAVYWGYQQYRER